MKLYYFTGSGNSLYIAKQLSKKLNGKLIPIASIINQQIITVNCDFGIVFPVYFASNDCGIPLIVQKFIGKLTDINNKYIFAVCTSKFSPGSTIENTNKLLIKKGCELNSGFIINTSNKTIKEDLVSKFSKVKANSNNSYYQEDLIQAQVERVTYIVNNREKAKLDTRSLFTKIIMSPVRILAKILFKARYQKLAGIKSKKFGDLINYADNSFRVKDNCTGCGICEKVCPVNNIVMKNNRPTWSNNCENCLACYQFCPQNALTGKIVEYNNRYHHPKIKLEDITAQKN